MTKQRKKAAVTKAKAGTRASKTATKTRIAKRQATASTIRTSRDTESEAAIAARAATSPARFKSKGAQVEIRTDEERVELEIDGQVHAVRFLDNGRPFTSAYVNVMAKDVRDLAEKFVIARAAQEAHWAGLAKTVGSSEEVRGKNPG